MEFAFSADLVLQIVTGNEFLGKDLERNSAFGFLLPRQVNLPESAGANLTAYVEVVQ